MFTKTYDFATKEAQYRRQARERGAWTLVHAARDAKEAADAMRGWNPAQECYYLDDVNTICKIMREEGVSVPMR